VFVGIVTLDEEVGLGESFESHLITINNIYGISSNTLILQKYISAKKTTERAIKQKIYTKMQ